MPRAVARSSGASCRNGGQVAEPAQRTVSGARRVGRLQELDDAQLGQRGAGSQRARLVDVMLEVEARLDQLVVSRRALREEAEGRAE